MYDELNRMRAEGEAINQRLKASVDASIKDYAAREENRHKTVTVWVTGWPSTNGIRRVETCLPSDDLPCTWENYYWHRTRDGAVACAEKMRAEEIARRNGKIKVHREAIEALQALSFDLPICG